MKTKITQTFFVVAIIVSTFLFVKSSSAQINLKGKWTVKCALDRVDKSSIGYCAICPTIIDTANASFKINDLHFAFTDKTLSITKDNETTTVDAKCKIDMEEQTLEFKYEGNEYEFSVLFVDLNNFILRQKKTEDILLMTREN